MHSDMRRELRIGWSRILAEPELQHISRKPWVHNLQPVTISGDTLILAAPTRFQANKVREDHVSLLKKVVPRHFHGVTRITLEVDPSAVRSGGLD